VKSNKKKLKERAWKLFSKYIRLRDADKDGYNTCVTCNKRDHYKNLQAGHFIDSRSNSVLFEEDLVFPQCCGCNLFKSGNKVNYTLFMLRKGYTAEELTEMVNRKHKAKKMTEEDYHDLIDKYNDLLVGIDMRRDSELDTPQKRM